MGLDVTFKIGSHGWVISTRDPFRVAGVPIDLTAGGWTAEAHVHAPDGEVTVSPATGDAGGGVTYVLTAADCDDLGVVRVVFWVDDGGANRLHSRDFSVAIVGA